MNKFILTATIICIISACSHQSNVTNRDTDQENTTSVNVEKAINNKLDIPINTSKKSSENLEEMLRHRPVQSVNKQESNLDDSQKNIVETFDSKNKESFKVKTKDSNIFFAGDSLGKVETDKPWLKKKEQSCYYPVTACPIRW